MDARLRVLTAVMPKGVEHSGNLNQRRLRCVVLTAVMPKGVEHPVYAGRAVRRVVC